MKILMVNKFYYIKGGSETYYFALKRLLESKGHEVIDFSMQDEKNLPSPYADYFVPGVDYNGTMSAGQKLRAAKNIIYSKEAKKRFEALVKEVKPDLVHLHIFQHQLSPSILDICKKYRLPVVYTAHDLKMLCLNYVMMNRNGICEKCRGGHYINCLRQKCVKESTSKSLINTCEGYFHKWRKSYDIISKVITPSKFYHDKFVEFGIRQERVVWLANFLDRVKPFINVREDKEKYFLYFGRLSHEKGVSTLVRAYSMYKKDSQSDSMLYIVGTGPSEEEIRKLVEQQEISGITMLGYRSGQELIDLVGNARAVILPSEWYENGPYTAIEALQCGRPIIGSKIGGIPELVDGNGTLFPQGEIQELEKALFKFPKPGTGEYYAMCHRSEEIFVKNYTAEQHYQKLINIYLETLNKVKSGVNHAKPEQYI